MEHGLWTAVEYGLLHQVNELYKIARDYITGTRLTRVNYLEREYYDEARVNRRKLAVVFTDVPVRVLHDRIDKKNIAPGTNSAAI